MSNYIIEYLTGGYAGGMQKEAGFLSKVMKFLGKTPKPVRSYTKKTFPSYEEPLLNRRELHNRWDRLYRIATGYDPMYPRGTKFTDAVIKDAGEELSNVHLMLNALPARLKDVKRVASVADNPNVIYDGGRKGLSAVLQNSPSTTSMTEGLARALSEDAAFAKNLGGNANFQVTPKATIKALSNLGLM